MAKKLGKAFSLLVAEIAKHVDTLDPKHGDVFISSMSGSVNLIVTVWGGTGSVIGNSVRASFPYTAEGVRQATGWIKNERSKRGA